MAEQTCKICGVDVHWGNSFCYDCRDDAEERAVADRRWVAERALRSRIVRAQQAVDERQESHAARRAEAKKAFADEINWALYAAEAEDKLRNLQTELAALSAEREQEDGRATWPNGATDRDGDWLEDDAQGGVDRG